MKRKIERDEIKYDAYGDFNRSFYLICRFDIFFQKMSSVFVRNSDSEFRSSILSSDDDTTDSRLSNPKTEEKTVS